MKIATYLVHNPRWAGKRCVYPPKVMDRIYTLEYGLSMNLEKVEIFGAEVSDETGWAASDHYGVVAEIEMEE